MDHQNWRKKAMKLLNKENKNLIPNFRQNLTRHTISEIHTEMKEKNEGIFYTKEVVEQLLNDNEKRMYKLDDNFKAVSDMSPDEKIDKLKKRMKNEFVIKLKDTYATIKEHNKH